MSALHIVIIGGGEIGFNLAKHLSDDDYDIVVIDIDPNKCKKIKNNIDARVIEGDGVSQRVLQQIDMPSVDYLIAVTRIDEVNLVASRIAHQMGAKKIICRLRNTEYTHRTAVVKPSQFGIDYIVYPEMAAQKEISEIIDKSSVVEVQAFMDDQVKMVGLVIDSSSSLIGRTVENVLLSNPFVKHKTVLIFRNDESFVPHQQTTYKKDDIVYFTGLDEDINSILKMVGKPPFNVKNILILGAGKVGRLLAKELQTDYDVRIVEKNQEKAHLIDQKLNEVLMLVGDGLDIDFLESENISDVDCFVAVTENEQTNILANLIVKHYGVKLSILHISTTSYLKSIRRIGVDAVISKNISAVNEVMKIIKSDVNDLVVSSFEELDIDALEIRVSPDCKYIKKKYRLSDIPESICLASISRGNKNIIPSKKTEILENDLILLFTKEENLKKAERIFI